MSEFVRDNFLNGSEENDLSLVLIDNLLLSMVDIKGTDLLITSNNPLIIAFENNQKSLSNKNIDDLKVRSLVSEVHGQEALIKIDNGRFLESIYEIESESGQKHYFECIATSFLKNGRRHTSLHWKLLNKENNK